MYQTIDALIESYYFSNPLKACIMVGEDIDTAIAGSHDHLAKPSTVPWYTTGRITSYQIQDNQIIAQPYRMNLCISLLYPTSTLPYETKKDQLVNAFTKFSTQRYYQYTKTITVLESEQLSSASTSLYQHLDQFGLLTNQIEPTSTQLSTAINNPSSFFFVHGHSNPSGTELSAQHTWFSTDILDSLQSPVFGADGCYTNGWWTNQTNTTILSQSINTPWYGSKIFTSPSVQVMILGLLSQNGYDYPVSFLENAIPDLVNGKTLAESLIGHTYIGDNPLIIGDPSFHFSE
jgi:hypothetical protein